MDYKSIVLVGMIILASPILLVIWLFDGIHTELLCRRYLRKRNSF